MCFSLLFDMFVCIKCKEEVRRWLGDAKVSCSFCHRGALLILADSWARPVVLAAGKGRG